MAATTPFAFADFDFTKAVKDFYLFSVNSQSSFDVSDVTPKTYPSIVSNILLENAHNNVAVNKDWSLETIELLRGALGTELKPAAIAKTGSGLASEGLNNAVAYLPKYGKLAFETNANLWAAWLALFKIPAGVPAAANAEEAPVAEIKAEDAAPAFVDDIELIDGIGPIIAKKLRMRNINSLKQIAAFTPEEIETIEVEMAFRGRITRDEWIDQAKELIAGKAPRAKIDQAKLA